MTGIIKYDAACRALAECKAVDEVKSWADKAAAMQAYGRMAQDRGLETDAAEIRLRAERRLGELLAQSPKNTGAKGIGKSAVVSDDRTPTLADAGISKDLSARAQKLAAVPEAEFEQEISEWREETAESNKRVVARLEAKGSGKVPKADPKDRRIAELETKVAELTDEIELVRDGAQEAVIAAETAAALLDTEPAKIIAAKEAEIQRLTRDRDEWMNKCGQMVKQIAAMQRKLDRLERAAA